MRKNKKILLLFLSVLGIISICEAADKMYLPQKPDLERLRHDLVGRKMSQVSDSYFPSGWYIDIIDESEIAKISVLSSSYEDGSLFYKLNVYVKEEYIIYKATVDMVYYLTSKYKWAVDYLNTKDIVIVPTGKYNNCITASIKGWSGEYQLELKNSSDVKLIVGGVVRYEYGDGVWKRFSALVDGHETVALGGLFLGSVEDFRIHFVERY